MTHWSCKKQDGVKAKGRQGRKEGIEAQQTRKKGRGGNNKLSHKKDCVSLKEQTARCSNCGGLHPARLSKEKRKYYQQREEDEHMLQHHGQAIRTSEKGKNQEPNATPYPP